MLLFEKVDIVIFSSLVARNFAAGIILLSEGNHLDVYFCFRRQVAYSDMFKGAEILMYECKIRYINAFFGQGYGA